MKYFCLFALIAVSALSAPSQDSQISTDLIKSSDSGEVAASLLDQLAVETFKSRERVFVISRKGTLDTNKKIALGRLMSARHNRSVKSFDPITTVLAEGTQIAGEGRLEFYVGSDLRLVIFAPRNEVPNLTCCPDYFPPPKRKRKKAIRKY